MNKIMHASNARFLEKEGEALLAVNEIRQQRSEGNLPRAIEIALEARNKWAKDYYFCKILADLYFETGDLRASFFSLADFVERMPLRRQLVSDFAKRYRRLKRVLSAEKISELAEGLADALRESSVDKRLIESINQIIISDLKEESAPEFASSVEDFKVFIRSDTDFDKFVSAERAIALLGNGALAAVLNGFILNRERSLEYIRIDFYCVSLY
jgi:hypothetical protein